MPKLEMETKKGKLLFDIEVQIIPTPKSCRDCPFFYVSDIDKDCGYKICDYFLQSIEVRNGIALERPDNCPLNTGI